jgi:hypothetical protein
MMIIIDEIYQWINPSMYFVKIKCKNIDCPQKLICILYGELSICNKNKIEVKLNVHINNAHKHQIHYNLIKSLLPFHE